MFIYISTIHKIGSFGNSETQLRKFLPSNIQIELLSLTGSCRVRDDKVFQAHWYTLLWLSGIKNSDFKTLELPRNVISEKVWSQTEGKLVPWKETVLSLTTCQPTSAMMLKRTTLSHYLFSYAYLLNLNLMSGP